MRHWVVLILFLLALGALRMVGCGDESPCGNCDDGNPCTMDNCVSDELVLCEVAHRCEHPPVTNGTPCGPDTVCVSGVCGENLCEGVVCEDNDACTDDHCDYVDGSCYVTPTMCFDGDDCTKDTCNPADGCNYTPVEDGTHCFGEFIPAPMGTCEAGVCVAPCDPASEEIREPSVHPGSVTCVAYSDFCVSVRW